MKRDILALIAIAALITVFFFRLFRPEPLIIVTPDFGRSDAWHFSFATKLALAQSLTRGQLPLWEPRMGMGFALFAEGQVGALFLPNLILFKIIPNPVVAYNATYVVLFLVLGWGMYAWLRVIGCSRPASLFGAITITFSGQTIPRLPHHTLLESLSMTPLILALAHQVLTKKHLIWTSLFAFTLSQQLFTGSPQPVLLTLLMVGIYAIFSRGSLTKFTLSIVLGVGIAAIQLIPSSEMLRESTSPAGFSPEEASYYSLPLVHLKTLVAPFILGNPKLGTYPPFTTFDGSIFWENNLFIGWLPLVVLLLSFARYFLAKLQGSTLKNSRFITFCVIALFASFLLMLGKHSPLYLLYSVWPLNLFRVPSRFAWIFLITIISAASWSLSRKKIISILAILLIALHTYQLMSAWWDYHAIQPANQWLTATPFIDAVKKTGRSVRSIGSELVHNQQFLKQGWRGNLDRYQFLRSTLAPNSNLYWDVTQTDVYAGRFLKRPALVENLLANEIKASGSVATISAQGKRLLELYHADTIISTLPLDITKPLPVLTATKSGTITITAYRNADSLPRAYLATQTIVAPTLTKAAEALAGPTFTPGKSVLVHDAARSVNEEGVAGSVEITGEHPTRVTMRADVLGEREILVFGDTYYPGWQATVDGQPTEIFPVNIKERGILLSKGNHEIIWQYQPKSILIGAWVSALSIIVAGFPVLLALFRRQT